MPQLLSRACIALAIWFAPVSVCIAVPTVWPGFTYEFVHPSGSTITDPITPNVALARGFGQGLFNAVVDNGWNGSGPTGTEWATDLNNPGGSIAATNYAALTFESWLDAYGGLTNVGRSIEGRDAVVRLTGDPTPDDDIYLDLRFTDWIDGLSEGGGGGFTYLRAVAPPATAPTGDYNGNNIVDAADYVLWRDTLTQAAVPPGSGADGNESGTIDQGDYDFWRARFGNAVPGGGAGLAAAIPEPACAVLSLLGLLGFQSCSGRRRRVGRHFSRVPT